MYLRPVIFCLMVLLSLANAGCNGARETDDIAYAVTVGIDAAPDNQLAITYRLAVPEALSSGEGGGGGKDKKTSQLITVTAPSLAEGRNLLNTSVSRAVNLSQIKALFIGEELARRGLADLIGPFIRFREFRESMFLIVIQGSTAKEFMEKNQPEFELLTSRWVESSIATSSETSSYLTTHFHQFYQRLKGDSGAPYAIAMGTNPLSGENNYQQEPVANDKTPEYLPNEIPKQGGNPSVVMGTAVFKSDKLVGFLTDKQTRGLSILMNKFPAGFFTVDDPLEPGKSVNAQVRLGEKPHIGVDISTEKPVITIDVFFEGEISSIASGIFYESPAYTSLLENQISNVIYEQINEMLQITQSWGTDVVDFGYYIRPQFATIQEFNHYQWDSKYPQAVIRLQVKTELRRTGLMRKSIPIRKD